MENNSISEDWKNITDPVLRKKAKEKAQRRAYYLANKARINAANRASYLKNREKTLIRQKKYNLENKDIRDAWYEKNKEKLKIKNKIWRKANEQKLKQYSETYYLTKRDEILAQKKIYNKSKKDIRKINFKSYYKKNKDVINAKNKIWRDSNKDKIKAYHKAHSQVRRENENNRFKSDIQYKLTKNLRNRLYSSIKDDYKTGSAVRDLGCSIDELKVYLESKFQPGMSWDNWNCNGWHIDHIKPLSSFDLTDRNQFLQACHYTNLQPLWAKDNICKRDKIL